MNLSSLKTSQGMYGLVNFDESEELTRLLGLRTDDAATSHYLTELNRLLIQEVSAVCSGLVLDPRYSLSVLASKAAATGLAFRLTAETDMEPNLPKFIPQWGVEEVKNNLAIAKLTLLYHPMEQLALDKKKFLSEVYDFCQYEKIPFVLDLLMTGVGGGKIHVDDMAEAQLDAVQELRTSCDLIALEYPGNPLATATLTAELDIPWILVSRTSTYDEYKEQLRIALENGAKGFLVGRSLWMELAQMRNQDMTPDKTAIHRFFATTVRDRIIELVRIANEVAQKQPLDLGL